MGKKNYTNGVETKRFIEGTEPDGWYRGVAPWSEDKKRKASDKRKSTYMSKYGVENISQVDSVKTKKRETLLRNYGVESPLQSSEIQEKLKSTMQNRYGVDYAQQSVEIRETTRESCIEKYGVDHPMKSEEIKEKYKQIILDKYGVDNINNIDSTHSKSKSTSMSRYGVLSPNQSDGVKTKKKETLLRNYGVESPLQSEEIRDRFKDSCLEHYGVDNPSKSGEIKKKKESQSLEKYGTKYVLQSEEIKKKVSDTCQEKYGVPWSCMRPEARIGSNDSKPNRDFSSMLDVCGISYEREFHIDSYSYDFKVGNILIEINPTVTHNTIWSPFGDNKGISVDYHYNKYVCAINNGYRCIHVFDWDDINKIINLLKPRERVYARDCEIMYVSKKDADMYLNKYHLQGTCRGQLVKVGLYYNGDIVSLMSLGKPRYNKNCEYELLRCCSSHFVIGGEEKLFSHFIRNHNPKSIIFYCDKSKFHGNTYSQLGFISNGSVPLSKHWYSPKEKRHITDNLLQRCGYDNLFNEFYGKGTSNEELMINRGYLPVYDCGQEVWVWHNSEIS